MTVIEFKKMQKEEQEPNDLDAIDENNVLKDGEQAWSCLCGNYLFFIERSRGILCSTCGQVQNWDYDK